MDDVVIVEIDPQPVCRVEPDRFPRYCAQHIRQPSEDIGFGASLKIGNQRLAAIGGEIL